MWFLVFDATSKESFDNLHMWIQEIERFGVNGGQDLIKVLVANKTDKTRAVTNAEGEEFAQQHGIIYAEVSAKTGEGIDEMISNLVREV